jgi:hypothetical protein
MTEQVRVFQITATSKEIAPGFIAVMGRAVEWINVGDVLHQEKGGAAFTVYQIDAHSKEVDKISPFAECGLIMEGSGRLRDGEFLLGLHHD